MKTPKTKAAIPKGGNDCIMTPDSLAFAIVQHFRPTGAVLEPCAGRGAFVKALFDYNAANTKKELREKWAGPGSLMVVEKPINHSDSMELEDGQDFIQDGPPLIYYDWIITNPPWSKFLAFIKESMTRSHNVVFLAYANAWFVKSRINAMEAAGFHFREFAYVANPKKPWPQMGLQMAAVHISREPGNCVFSKIDWKP